MERFDGDSYKIMPLAAVNDTLQRFFGITITDTEASSEFYHTPLSWSYTSNRCAMYYYMNGRFYTPGADGERYTKLTIVNLAEPLEDGTLRLHFDIYSLDWRECLGGSGVVVDPSYYYLTSEQAAQNRYLTKETSGIAVVRPYEYNGEHTYQLIKYNIGDDLITEPVNQQLNWSEIYCSFILNEEYMYINQPIFRNKYNVSFPIVFSLHDLDADGTPELIMHNGAGGALATEYVFTCKNGKIKYVGNVGFMGCRLYFYNDKNYPGLFCSDGRQGLYWEEYYSLNDGAIVCQDVEEGEYSGETEEPIRTKKTNDDALYNLSISGGAISLEQFTEEEIRTMGWEVFLSKYGYIKIQFDNSSTYVNFKWYPNILFSKEPTGYDKDLAIAGLTLSGAVYNGFDSIDSTFKSLGYSVDPHWNLYYDRIEVNWPGHSIYSRPINVNGKSKMLITLAIEGTRNIVTPDVLTDIIGGGTSFGIAADNVKSSLDAYVKKYYNDLPSDDIIYFITGHSLGGATAGRVAKKLLEAGAPENNVFCYPVAPPHNAVSIGGEECKNIHNIINEWDLVPHMGISQTVGELHIFYYDKYKKEIGDTYKKMFDTEIPDYWLGMHELKTYLALLCGVPEGEIEYMIEPSEPGCRVVKILCPVDVNVYDSAGQLVGCNQVNESSQIQGVFLAVVNDDEKYIYLPYDDEFSLRLTGTDNGTMDYIVQNMAYDGTILESTEYSDVQLTKGKIMTTEIGGAIGTADIELAVVDKNGKAIAEVQKDGTEIAVNQNNIVIPVIIGIGAIVLIALAILFLWKRQNRNKNMQ